MHTRLHIAHAHVCGVHAHVHALMGPAARLTRCPFAAIGPSSRRLSWYCSGSCERLSTHSGAYMQREPGAAAAMQLRRGAVQRHLGGRG